MHNLFYGVEMEFTFKRIILLRATRVQERGTCGVQVVFVTWQRVTEGGRLPNCTVPVTYGKK